MADFLRAHQLNIMLALSSMCMLIAFFAAITKTLSDRRKMALIYLEISAAVLLMADRYAYIFRGDESRYGFWMVRVTNFLVFMMTAAVLHALNIYLADFFVSDLKFKEPPMALRIMEIVVSLDWCLIIVSQFTGLLYTFDASNRYVRGQFYVLAYVAPLIVIIVHMYLVIKNYKLFGRIIRHGLLIAYLIPLGAAFVQLFAYGLSLVNIALVVMAFVVYVFAIIELNDAVDKANKLTIENLEGEKRSMQSLFEQTAGAITAVVDAKDKYTRGHSKRVADYSREIAKRAGLSDEECDEVYFAALLHDVGKISIPDSIINKRDRLTAEEYEIVKNHSIVGSDMLSKITEFPYIATVAKYHHERYDGEGYPEGKRGEEIPVYARIIAVADAYDAMTSKRSFRDPYPQKTVRDEIVKGAGYQFDPKFAGIMVDMIDQDVEYLMRETVDDSVKVNSVDLTTTDDAHFGEYRNLVSDGIAIDSVITTVTMNVEPDAGAEKNMAMPAIILFGSHDGCVHEDDRSIKLLSYIEYGELFFDGHKICTAARDVRVTKGSTTSLRGMYSVEAVRYDDHIRIDIHNGEDHLQYVVVLREDVRNVYMALTGENCSIDKVRISRGKKSISEDYIERIVPKVGHINRLNGDLENVEIEGYHTAKTQGIRVVDGLRIAFHTQTLPYSNHIWDCPHVMLYTVPEGKEDTSDYTIKSCIRFDGEEIGDVDRSSVVIEAKRNENFEGWDAWKEYNKAGAECEILFERKRNRIVMYTVNHGVEIKHTTKLSSGDLIVYVGITGENCALTNIRVYGGID